MIAPGGKNMDGYDKTWNKVPFDTLVGKVPVEIVWVYEEIWFRCSDGEVFCMYHEQDCCEDVSVEDINGDLNYLVGHEILSAYESTQRSTGGEAESETWTFYHIRSHGADITIRWYGTSSGYYSESVSFTRAKVEQ